MFNPYLLLGGVLIWLATAVGGFFYGEHVENLSWIAKEAKATAEVQAMKDAADMRGQILVAQIQKVTLERDNYYRKLQGKINEATDGRVCFANPDAVRVWNESLSAGNLSHAAAGAAEAATRASATDRDILANAIENNKQYIECRAQYAALKSWNETIGAGKGK